VRAGSSAFTLIELLVYMSMLFLVLGFAYMAADKSMDASVALRRDARDISRALQAGERWREDMRHATRPARLQQAAPDEALLQIPQPRGEVDYLVSTNGVCRRENGKPWVVLLDGIKNSNFTPDQRQNVAAWRWDLELRPNQKRIGRMRPLFTFIATTTHNSAL
jgi:type II secretory pathway component PulJ